MIKEIIEKPQDMLKSPYVLEFLGLDEKSAYLEQAREYYIQESADFNWSTRQLERNINSLYYERLLTSSDKQKALQDAQAMR